MTSPDFFQFLSRALDALAAEVPAAYARLALILDGTDVRLTVDGGTRCLVSRRGKCLLTADGGASTELRTARATLTALLGARQSLLDAILADDLVLRGAPDDVAALHDALVAFLQGAVRSPSMPALLAVYLHDTPRPRARAKGDDRKGTRPWPTK